MHYILGEGHKLWGWLVADNGVRATVFLVFITAWYSFTTHSMARAIARQTHAMIQPVARLKVHWENDASYNARGYFEIKNVGTQPLLILDIKLSCHAGGEETFVETFNLWDEHIIPPGESLCPEFDFTRDLSALEESLPFPMEPGYSLEVVTSDLNQQVVLRYLDSTALGISNVQKGKPLSVRWRYFLKRLRWRYHRLRRRFTGPKTN